MASLSTPALILGNTANSKRDVTINGSITFDAGDVGKTFRLEIKVYGEDLSNDTLPSGDAVGDDLIYTYQWVNGLVVAPYKSVTVAAAGTVNYSEKRAIDIAKLDEDSGNKIVGWADINTPILMPRKDEVYARVTLSGATVSAKTPTVTAGAGV